VHAVVLCGIQASGKTSFYVERFLETHVRISLDLFRTRHREEVFLLACLQTRQPFAVDKTNPTADERRRYVQPALELGYRVDAYWFDIAPREAIARNAKRPEGRQIPCRGSWGRASGSSRPPSRRGSPRSTVCARPPTETSWSSSWRGTERRLRLWP
jgi:AAA domain